MNQNAKVSKLTTSFTMAASEQPLYPELEEFGIDDPQRNKSCENPCFGGKNTKE